MAIPVAVLVAHPSVEGLARAIQLSVSPVFLLAALSGLLGVLSQRLGRIIDRSRHLQQGHGPAGEPAGRAVRQEGQMLQQRMVLILRAIQLATLAFLLVALVVALLFVSTLGPWNLAPPVAVLFVLAMLALMAAVLLFLREVQLASRLRLRF